MTQWRAEARKAFLGHLGAEEQAMWGGLFNPRWLALDAALDVAELYIRADEREQMRQSMTRAFLADLGDQCRAEGAAAERDRIRQLAIDVDALYMRQTASAPDYGVTEVDAPFADLIGES